MNRQKAILLNASNMESYPVYPYTFIQVPAIARRAGVEVACKDLLGIPQDSWGESIRNLIERHEPSMVLITLRNTDSMVAKDYQRDALKEGDGRAYFPIERTKELIAAIQGVTDLKIAVGGFGFSLLAEELMRYLRPDFGVFGGPDGFFEHFYEIRQGEYAQVSNLLYLQEGELIANPRRFYPPFSGAEYSSRAIKEMMSFYDAFPSPGFQGAPVEIMRGCCHTCVFCAEPHVEGARVQYRDLSAVMADIEILADQGVSRLYMISSELNPEGNEFLL
ncbi:MAG: hypothetical protein U9R58_11285, partial [Chloroflexota bacterium]|nr:hypothetical protein [Chloroflexota bacterium]